MKYEVRSKQRAIHCQLSTGFCLQLTVYFLLFVPYSQLHQSQDGSPAVKPRVKGKQKAVHWILRTCLLAL